MLDGVAAQPLPRRLTRSPLPQVVGCEPCPSTGGWRQPGCLPRSWLRLKAGGVGANNRVGTGRSTVTIPATRSETLDGRPAPRTHDLVRPRQIDGEQLPAHRSPVRAVTARPDVSEAGGHRRSRQAHREKGYGPCRSHETLNEKRSRLWLSRPESAGSESGAAKIHCAGAVEPGGSCTSASARHARQARWIVSRAPDGSG